ncbi:hypothetical protein [Streptomyces sp. NPDC054838]
MDDTGARRGGRTGAVLRRALTTLLLAGVAVACGPDTGSAPARSLAPATPSAVASAPPSATPLPGPSATASASASAPATVAVATPSAEPTTRPAAKPTTQDPAPEPTREATPAAETSCEIVSDAGNCYKAGQFCRKADVGRETHGANGRLIHCRPDGSRSRWNY